MIHLPRCSRTSQRLASFAIAAALSLISPQQAIAQSRPAAPEIEMSAVERLALARACAQMQTVIDRIPIAKDLTFGQWVARDIGLDRAFREWVRTLRPASPSQTYSDMTCDIAVELDAAALIDQIRDWHARFPKASPANDPTADAIAKAIRAMPALRVIGTGESPAASVAERPRGWEDASDEAIDLARRAATADALNHLLEEAARLKVTSARRMSEFLASSQQVHSAAMAGFKAAAVCDVRLGPDQVAEATARLSIAEVIRVVTAVHNAHYAGDLFHADAFREMALNATSGELVATGVATPPARSRTPADDVILAAPPWATDEIEAVGLYLRPDSAPDRAYAETEASAAARERLRELVLSLELSSSRRVSDVLVVRPNLAADVELFLATARPVGNAIVRSDGAIERRVVLPLERLWRIMRRGLHEIESSPPDNPASSALKSEIES